MDIHPVRPSGARRRRPTPDVARVLIVDDQPADATATEALLVAGGYDVAVESRGDGALRMARASLVRLVISELYIPCGEGRCVVEALKDDRARLPRLRVLVHTRHSRPADIEWALAAGGDAVVLKTAGPGILLREVQRLDGATEAA